jgi:methylated-DNA-[protein]-cysteine S-methyltransferase
LRRHRDARTGDPGDVIAAAIAAVVRLLNGSREDLRFVPVDMAGLSPFERGAYEKLRAVLPGETITYGELAHRCAAPHGARAIGAAMGRNPVPVIIPCHRVLASGGRRGGFSAPGGLTTKFRLLQIEQAGCGGKGLFAELPLAMRR